MFRTTLVARRYVCMAIAFSKSMDQLGEVASPARGQLNGENEYFLVPVRARGFGLARRARPPDPASACSLSILRLNLVLTDGIPPDFAVYGVYCISHHDTRNMASRTTSRTMRWLALLRG